MRATIWITVALALAACGGEDSEEGPPPPADDSVEAREPPEAPSAEEAAEPMTEGFIRVTIDGAERRFEHTAARHNQATTRMTVIRAAAGPDAEERVEILLPGYDVRTLDYPRTFARRRGGGGLAAAMQIPTLKYRDPQGRNFVYVFGETLECQSLEELTLRCTFEGEPRHGDSGETVHLTDGELEVTLTQSGFVDAVGDVTAGQAVEGAQEAIDRRRGR